MSEFFQSYGFFIIIAVLMLACHLLHFGGTAAGIWLSPPPERATTTYEGIAKT